jgi:3-oxoacyl-[acyl-carrier-protein] synthase-1
MSDGVVITGYGCLTASGADVATTWEAILAGESGIREASTWDSSGWPYRLAGEIKDYKPRELVADRKLLKFITRQDVIGLNAMTQAVDHSGIIEHRDGLVDPTAFNDRTGVFVGSPGVRCSCDGRRSSHVAAADAAQQRAGLRRDPVRIQRCER